MVPGFPGQTHAFFWREIAELERAGVELQLLSTRPPVDGLIAHDWSAEARARTAYLLPPAAVDLWRGLRKLPDGLRLAAGEGQGLRLAREVMQAMPLATRLAALSREMGLAHLHVHSCARAALIAALARRMGGPSYSLTLHGPLADYGPGQALKWQFAAFGTVITETLHRQLAETLGPQRPERLIIQPMGVDSDRFRRPAPYRPHDGQGPLRVFSCARLNLVKGHLETLRAIAMLRAAGMDVRLTIAGEDDDGGSGFRREVEAEIAALGLDAHVALLGAVDEDTVRAQLLEAHLFVLASWHEPLGVAYMEAMSCEVPVIGTRAGGVQELITDGCEGILVPPRDVPALAAAMRQLAADSAACRAMGRAGRARVLAGFSARSGAQTLLAEIQRCTGTTLHNAGDAQGMAGR